jgi:hypothetical protein
MTLSDDPLATAVIGLLRDIKTQQDTQAIKSSSLERAMLSLTQGFAALDDRRLSTLVAALWGLAAAALLNGIIIAAALLVAAARLGGM